MKLRTMLATAILVALAVPAAAGQARHHHHHHHHHEHVHDQARRLPKLCLTHEEAREARLDRMQTGLRLRDDQLGAWLAYAAAVRDAGLAFDRLCHETKGVSFPTELPERIALMADVADVRETVANRVHRAATDLYGVLDDRQRVRIDVMSEHAVVHDAFTNHHPVTVHHSHARHRHGHGHRHGLHHHHDDHHHGHHHGNDRDAHHDHDDHGHGHRH